MAARAMHKDRVRHLIHGVDHPVLERQPHGKEPLQVATRRLPAYGSILTCAVKISRNFCFSAGVSFLLSFSASRVKRTSNGFTRPLRKLHPGTAFALFPFA